jgi:transposase-like protein
MRCKCGGITTVEKVNLTYRDKKYRVPRFKCIECQKQFYLTSFRVPLKTRKNHEEVTN